MFARAYAGVLDGDERWRRLDAPSSATFPPYVLRDLLARPAGGALSRG
ncbi:hypothetical protein [Nonomuraea longispora]|nr:hypothetical protein [Nonomuraea longispora]